MNNRTVAATAMCVAASLAPSVTHAAWPQQRSDTEDTPILYDLDRDGRKEVIAGTQIHDLDGNVIMRCPLDGTWFTGSTPAIADLDGDGSPEIVVSAAGSPSVGVFDATCHFKPGWPVTFADSSLRGTAPTVIDLDGDGTLEVAVATSSGVFVYRHDGTPLPNWPFLWTRTQFSIPSSGLAAGDVDGDGSPELVVQHYDYTLGNKLYVLTAAGGVAPGWPASAARSESSPALADLDDDGHLEIVTQDESSFVRVFRFDGSYQSGWPRPYGPCPNGCYASPAIADVDGDGTLEIIAVASSGLLYVFRQDGSSFPGFPFNTGGTSIISSPSVIDVDGDGRKDFFLQHLVLTFGLYSPVVTGWRLDGTVLPGFPRTLLASTDNTTRSSTDIADAEGQGHYSLTVGVRGHSSSLTWFLPIPSSTVTPGAEIDAWPRIHHDATNGSCLCTPRRHCPDDGDPCTDDEFDAAGACTHPPKPDGTPCNDGDACTRSDACQSGVCTGSSPVVCSAPDPCHSAGVCDSGSGSCNFAPLPDGTVCDDGDSATTNDVCTAGVCAGRSDCSVQPKPKSEGYYKKLCKDGTPTPHAGDMLTAADAVCVGQLTATFAGISTPEEICDIYDHDSSNHDSNGPLSKDCQKGERELIALALNICRDRVCLSQMVDSRCQGGNNHVLTTVAASLATVDGILSDPARIKTTCQDGRCLAKEINSGKGLHQTSLTLTKEPGPGNNVRLNWESPVFDDGSGEARRYTIWRRVLNADAAWVKMTDTGNLTWVDATAGTGTYEYDVTFTFDP